MQIMEKQPFEESQIRPAGADQEVGGYALCPSRPADMTAQDVVMQGPSAGTKLAPGQDRAIIAVLIGLLSR
jgi:hypothetical protein